MSELLQNKLVTKALFPERLALVVVGAGGCVKSGGGGMQGRFEEPRNGPGEWRDKDHLSKREEGK